MQGELTQPAEHRSSGGAAWAPAGRTLLSAVAVAASFPPWDLPGVIWVALLPWLAALGRARSPGAAAVQGFWLAFGIGLLAAPWMAVALHEYLRLPWPAAAVGLGVFAAILAQPHLVLYALVHRWLGGRLERSGAQTHTAAALLTCVGLALVYVGLDALVPRLFDVGLGYALHDAQRLRQLAALGGVPLLTGLVVLVNLLLLRATEPLTRGAEGRPRAVLPLALAAALVLGALGYGELRRRATAELATAPDRTLRVALVQGNVPNAVRLAWAAGDDRAAERQLAAYTLPTEELVARDPRPDLVVWPEATFPGVFRQPGTKLQRGRNAKFDRQLLRLGVPFAFGAYDMTGSDADRTFYNALFLVNPSPKPGRQGLVQRYHKHELLAFAERVPFAAPGSWLGERLPGLARFGRGDGASVMRLTPPGGGSVLVSPVICSETLHASYVAEGARAGSQLILSIGSDGWFGRFGEPDFHLAIARLRSVETGLPHVRATNTGISALILPDGGIATRSEVDTRQILDAAVPVTASERLRPTPYLQGGHAFPAVGGAFGAGVLALLAGWRRGGAPARVGSPG